MKIELKKLISLSLSVVLAVVLLNTTLFSSVSETQISQAGTEQSNSPAIPVVSSSSNTTVSVQNKEVASCGAIFRSINQLLSGWCGDIIITPAQIETATSVVVRAEPNFSNAEVVVVSTKTAYQDRKSLTSHNNDQSVGLLMGTNNKNPEFLETKLKQTRAIGIDYVVAGTSDSLMSVVMRC